MALLAALRTTLRPRPHLLPVASASYASASRVCAQAAASASSAAGGSAPQPPPAGDAAPQKGTDKAAAPALAFTSSCPPGTVLTGLGLLKDTPDPVARPDADYPAWLWELHTAGASGSAVAGASAGMTKGEQRAALKRASKLRKGGEKKAEVAVDDSPEGQRKALRRKNREAIKARNFVSSN